MNHIEKIIESRIYLIRGQKVMLDSDLAILYNIETFNLNKAVKRNIDRFPPEFMFRLTKDEFDDLTFQIGISKYSGQGGRRYMPYAFTEQGVAMLSSVLKSKTAIQINIAIMKTFVRMRELLTTHKELANKISEIETRVDFHDETLVELIEAVKKLLPMANTPNKQKIGF